MDTSWTQDQPSELSEPREDLNRVLDVKKKYLLTMNIISFKKGQGQDQDQEDDQEEEAQQFDSYYEVGAGQGGAGMRSNNPFVAADATRAPGAYPNQRAQKRQTDILGDAPPAARPGLLGATPNDPNWHGGQQMSAYPVPGGHRGGQGDTLFPAYSGGQGAGGNGPKWVRLCAFVCCTLVFLLHSFFFFCLPV